MITRHDAGAIDVEALFDRHRWSGYQIAILLLASLAILFDGFDNQALGFALPSLMKEWGLPKQALAPALAVSQIGMLFGAIVGGWLGDRFGRKPLLVGSVALFGAATAAVAAISSIWALVVLRFIAGVGLGAAFPNVAAFASEFTPSRHRSLAVSISIVCVPLGGVVGGFVAAQILPAFGWRGLFLSAGLATLLVTILVALALPESVKFLLQTPNGTKQASRMLVRMGIDLEGPLPRVASVSDAPPASARAIFLEYPRDTAALWLAFFFCLTAIYAAFGWLPTLLTEQNAGIAVASEGLAYFNLGGVVAALATGWLMGRFGSRVPMVTLAIAAIAIAVAIILNPTDLVRHKVWLFAALFIEGGCINGVQTTLYALGAHIYPTRLRAFGVGAATGAGRIGAMSSSFLGAAVIGLGGAVGFHGLLAACMLVVTVALLTIRRHQPAKKVPPDGAAR